MIVYPLFLNFQPGPIPGMRPPMGGGAFQQAPPKGNSMGLIMPLYTLGIITFFVYTIMKIMVKKPPGQDRKTSIVTNGQPAKEKLPEKQEEPEEQLVIKRPQNGSSSKLGKLAGAHSWATLDVDFF